MGARRGIALSVGRDDPGAPNHTPNHESFCYVQGRERRSKPVSFSLLEKERFLESKEKGAPRRVRWSQIGIRRPGFTPPLRSSPVYGRLPRWNRGKLWFYPHFFRRLRGWASERGGAAWYSLCCAAWPPAGKRMTKTQKGAAPAMQGRLLLCVQSSQRVTTVPVAR